MIGSTIVYLPELPKDRSNLFESIIENEEFETLKLDALTSLDFAIINAENKTKWENEINPIVYDEACGFVIIHISKIGLKSVIEFSGSLDNIDKESMESDIASLKIFADKYGVDNLYEIVTF